MLFWVLAIASLAFLIVVHEGGHYFVARWCGMRIERFSIGFGPGVIKRRSKKTGTTFQIAPIPFGGFVEIKGMNIAEDVDPDDMAAYPNRPAWQRFVTIFAGPATNYISAVVVMFALYMFHGEASPQKYYGVDEVLADYDSVGKLAVGDRILAVDHEKVLLSSGPSLTERVTAKDGAPVTLTVERDDKQFDVSITPKLQTTKDGKKAYYVGIKPTEQFDMVDVGLIAAAKDALEFPIEKTQLIAVGLYRIVTGQEAADPGGPKRMVDEFRKAFSFGFGRGIELLALLSVYLGLFNLLPLPALDGGRLVFLGYEMVTRRRANAKIEATVHMAGIMVLFVVMILVTLRDFHVL